MSKNQHPQPSTHQLTRANAPRRKKQTATKALKRSKVLEEKKGGGIKFFACLLGPNLPDSSLPTLLSRFSWCVGFWGHGALWVGSGGYVGFVPWLPVWACGGCCWCRVVKVRVVLDSRYLMLGVVSRRGGGWLWPAGWTWRRGWRRRVLAGGAWSWSWPAVTGTVAVAARSRPVVVGAGPCGWSPGPRT